ncbi:hypothetical protein BKD09_15910 [Bradyrhizobium japonicum]|uniref:Uncharacterized protein n=1 Tax=Bradyrhizobium japonicum TaxID=375 RepID=A0A1L3F962_BRAJP|nr:hypothetical protein [Bradyrhizobium japonicum]APG09823.1 hypothetical protein BKD09_15910 [Bradyrhizobium japonicum]
MTKERAAPERPFHTDIDVAVIGMSALAGLLGQKEQLLARLEAGPGPNERAEIQALLAKIDTALKLLGAEESPGAEPTD